MAPNSYQYRTQDGASRRAARVSRYEDPYAEYDDYRPSETRRSSSREDIEDYRDHARYTSRSAASRTSGSSSNRSRNRTRSDGQARTSRASERSGQSGTNNRRQRAAQTQDPSGGRRRLAICAIILLILDIALAIGIYACGASLDEQAAAQASKAAPQASQAAYTIVDEGGLFET